MERTPVDEALHQACKWVEHLLQFAHQLAYEPQDQTSQEVLSELVGEFNKARQVMKDTFIASRTGLKGMPNIRGGHAFDNDQYTYVVLDSSQDGRVIKEVKDDTIYLEPVESMDYYTNLPIQCNRFNYSPFLGAGKSEEEALLETFEFSEYYKYRFAFIGKE